jgi:ribonuclease HII
MMMRRSSGQPRIDNHPGPILASDEAGVGPWAGPLVVAAATAPVGWDDPRVRDSKVFHQSTGEQAREQLYDELASDPRFRTEVLVLDSKTVDHMGVYRAQIHGHKEVLSRLLPGLENALLVVDGSLPVTTFGLPNIVALPKGDALVPECALASIFAKVTRDRLMRGYAAKYPGYGFERHKGYGGNPEHDAALAKLGLCDIHRRSFAPIRRIEEGMQSPEVDIFTLLGEIGE